MNKLIIRKTFGTKVDVPLKGAFYDTVDKKDITLLSDYGVAIGRDLAGKEKAFRFVFSEFNTEFLFQWDDKDEKRAAFAKFLKRHPLINHPDNENKGDTIYFELVDESRADQIQYQSENSKVVVYQQVKDMDALTLMEVAYFSLMDNPSKLEGIQLFNKLCGLDNGILMKDPNKFLTEWKMPDSTLKVVLKKAIILKIITSKDGLYEINNSPIGSLDNLMVHLKSDKKYYEYLKAEVAKKDTLPYGVTENISVSEMLEKEKPKEKKDRTLSQDIKDTNKAERDKKKLEADDRAATQKSRLRELKVNGWQASHTWAEKTRLKKIKEAEEKLESVGA